MRIAVCDDEEIILRQTRELLGRIAGEYFGQTEIECFSDNGEMLEEHGKNGFDIVILDIQMGPLDGFQTAERLSGMEHPCKLIFLSSREELVFQSFSYEPVYFVRKGSPDRMEEEFRRSFKRIREKRNREIFLSFTDQDDMIVKVFLTEIESSVRGELWRRKRRLWGNMDLSGFTGHSWSMGVMWYRSNGGCAPSS